jgi:Putative restriction endonuclease
MSDTVTTMTVHPPVDYAHLPGEEQNPLMESSLHAQWVMTLVNAASATLVNTDDLVTGNVPFDPGDGGPHLAPDLMVIPGAAGQDFTLYRVDDDHPLPTVCIEVTSRSNTRKHLDRRGRRMLEAGVSELYELHPRKGTIDRVELVDGELRLSNAVGTRSSGLQLSFARVDGELALCCPGGRMMRSGDRPLQWVAEEMRRADLAETKLDDAVARADEAVARARDAELRSAALEAELAELRKRRGDGTGPVVGA